WRVRCHRRFTRSGLARLTGRRCFAWHRGFAALRQFAGFWFLARRFVEWREAEVGRRIGELRLAEIAIFVLFVVLLDLLLGDLRFLGVYKLVKVGLEVAELGAVWLTEPRRRRHWRGDDV